MVYSVVVDIEQSHSSASRSSSKMSQLLRLCWVHAPVNEVTRSLPASEPSAALQSPRFSPQLTLPLLISHEEVTMRQKTGIKLIRMNLISTF